MFGKIIALLAVAACIATANGACYTGYGVYSNNGGVIGGVLGRSCGLPVVSTGAVAAPIISTGVATPVLSTGVATPVLSTGVATPVLSTGVVAAPVLSSRIVSSPVISAPVFGSCGAPFAPEVCNSCRSYVSPLYRDTVGCPEVLSSCENSAVGVYTGC